MIEVGDFRAGPDEAARFVNDCWSRQFPANISCPQWSSDYLRWQVFSRPDNIRIGAYEGERLVGSIFAERVTLRWGNRNVPAGMRSWLSVDPEMKRMGIARRVADELQRRLAAHRGEFHLGFGIPGAGSGGPKFWSSFENRVVRGVGLRPWVTALDGRRLSQTASAASERLIAGFSSILGLDKARRRDRDGAVRPYTSSDLADCLELTVAAEADADLSYEWSADRMAHHLDYDGVPKTLVYDDGKVRGFANWHKLDLRGRAPMRGGMIDFVIAAQARSDVQNTLLGSILSDMHQAGLEFAVCSPCASASKWVLLRNGLIPLPHAYHPFFFNISTKSNFDEIKKMKVLFR